MIVFLWWNGMDCLVLFFLGEVTFSASWPFTIKNLWLMLFWLQTAERTTPHRLTLWCLNVSETLDIKTSGLQGKPQTEIPQSWIIKALTWTTFCFFYALKNWGFILRTIPLDFEPVFYLSCFSGSLTSPCLLNSSSQLKCMPNLPS